MPILTLRQSELAEEVVPLITIMRVLKRAGFDLNSEYRREDDFFNDSVTFIQSSVIPMSATPKICTS